MQHALYYKTFKSNMCDGISKVIYIMLFQKLFEKVFVVDYLKYKKTNTNILFVKLYYCYLLI